MASAAKNNGHLKQQVLRQGQHFGEISLIYKCQTTASVIALKYCMVGKLLQKDFNDIITEHPMILKFLKEGIFEYTDKDIRFIKMSIKQMPYFCHLSDKDPILYDIIYAMRPYKMNAGDHLMQ